MIESFSSFGKLQLSKELQFLNTVTAHFAEDKGSNAIYQNIQVFYGLDKLLDPKSGEVNPVLRQTVQLGLEQHLRESLVLFQCLAPEEDIANQQSEAVDVESHA